MQHHLKTDIAVWFEAEILEKICGGLGFGFSVEAWPHLGNAVRHRPASRRFSQWVLEFHGFSARKRGFRHEKHISLPFLNHREAWWPLDWELKCDFEIIILSAFEGDGTS
jgi:hypothetical protein